MVNPLPPSLCELRRTGHDWRGSESCRSLGFARDGFLWKKSIYFHHSLRFWAFILMMGTEAISKLDFVLWRFFFHLAALCKSGNSIGYGHFHTPCQTKKALAISPKAVLKQLLVKTDILLILWTLEPASKDNFSMPGRACPNGPGGVFGIVSSSLRRNLPLLRAAAAGAKPC